MLRDVTYTFDHKLACRHDGVWPVVPYSGRGITVYLPSPTAAGTITFLLARQLAHACTTGKKKKGRTNHGPFKWKTMAENKQLQHRSDRDT